MTWLQMECWSPYLVGVGIGVLSWISFLLSNKPLGCSTAYARTGGMLEILLRGEKATGRLYFRKFLPTIDWEWMLVAGVVLGATLSARLSGTFHMDWVPALWEETFGARAWPRWLTALAGGAIMGFGARWAGGCTSGHGISGTLQLALSSWLATLSFFIGGVATAMFIFKVLV
jgi:uncharacterized membrane protein YedE/YeeE